MLVVKIFIFLWLLGGSTGLFYLLRKSRILKKTLRDAFDSLDSASLQRAKEHKKNLAIFESQAGMILKLEKRFLYSGLGRMFPFLTPEVWAIMRILSAGILYFICHFVGKSWVYGILAAAIFLLAAHLLESMLIHKNHKAVDDNLLEFLNILGNYSITAGEITGILSQVSQYMNEPLKSALDECYVEAQTSGNVDMALLTLADKIEHPKFKELVKSIEICARYSADFSVVVRSSRKVIQEYMKARQERKGLAQEATLNMSILLIMLSVVLVIVDQMLDASIWVVLTQTPIGQACMSIVAVLLAVFYWQISTADK